MWIRDIREILGGENKSLVGVKVIRRIWVLWEVLNWERFCIIFYVWVKVSLYFFCFKRLDGFYIYLNYIYFKKVYFCFLKKVYFINYMKKMWVTNLLYYVIMIWVRRGELRCIEENFIVWVWKEYGYGSRKESRFESRERERRNLGNIRMW